MSSMHDVIDFYANKAWIRSADNKEVQPSNDLLLDGGNLARAFLNAGPTEAQPENIQQSVLRISCMEVAEALRDLMRGMAMPPGENRVITIAGACIALQKAEHRMRSINRS